MATRTLLVSRLRRPLGGFAVCAVACLLAPTAWAQGDASAPSPRLTDVLDGDVALAEGQSTPRLEILRAGAFTAAPAAPGLALAVGDTLVSDSADVAARVRCSDGADVRLAEAFEAVVLPTSSELACNLLVLRGAAHVQTDEPTRLQSGETVMGSRSTQYSLRVGPSRRGGTVEEVVVYEGEIVLRAGSNRRSLGAGNKILVEARGASAVQTLDTQDVQRAAAIYARLDLAAAASDGRRSAVSLDAGATRRLASLYAPTFQRPDEPKARLELAAGQLEAKLPAWTALYQLDRAVESFERTGDDTGQAATRALRAVAYQRQGRAPEAETELRHAARLDPRVLRQEGTVRRIVTDTPGLDLSRLRTDSLSTTVPTPTTPDQRPGTTAVPRQLTVDVTPRVDTRSGKVTFEIEVLDGRWPVSGAQVALRTGGGRFESSGRSSAAGRTGRDGALRLEWSCAPYCAEAYRFTVQASAEGFAAASESVDVRLRR